MLPGIRPYQACGLDGLWNLEETTVGAQQWQLHQSLVDYAPKGVQPAPPGPAGTAAPTGALHPH
ncbi:hypothetical protein HaLaN_32760, partial [Haematococcus lacustris]